MIVSDGRDWAELKLPGPAWEHVSVSTPTTCPRWEEMCWVKGQFFRPDEWAIEYHPAKDCYVNHHPNCLHIWRAVGVNFPTPPLETV